MRALKLLSLIIAGLFVAGCEQAAENETAAASEESADADLLGGNEAVAEIGEPDSPLASNSDLASAGPFPEQSCERVGAAEAGGFAGLELTGTSGAYRFYGERRKLLCSEAGPEGRGECELVGPTVVRVEGPGETYGFRTASDAILTYAPNGFGCRPR